MILVTGAAGRVGSEISGALRDEYRLRLADRETVPEAGDAEVITGDLAEPALLSAATDGVDAVVHLAANASAVAMWEELYPSNVEATRLLFARAADAGVRRIVYMSSSHAAGLYDRDRIWPVDPTWPARPCCLYGVSKVLGEALGRFYAESGGPSVICLRLGSFQPAPRHARGVRTWVSARDVVGFVRHSLTTERQFGIYYAVSANTRLPWKIDNVEAELGYSPVDDSEQFVPQVDMTADSSPPCYREL